MALVDIKTGKNRKKFVEFAVVGEDGKGCKAGDIRWIWWSRHHDSPILKIDWTDSERTRAVDIRISADYKRKGWTLLRDMYEDEARRAPTQEDAEKVRQHMADFLAFADAQVNNPIGMAGEAFPEERLPAELQRMRSDARKAEKARKSFVFPSDGASLDDVKPKAAGRASKRSASA
jgi:hypothetical protein